METGISPQNFQNTKGASHEAFFVGQRIRQAKIAGRRVWNVGHGMSIEHLQKTLQKIKKIVGKEKER